MASMDPVPEKSEKMTSPSCRDKVCAWRCCCYIQKRYIVVILLSMGMFIAHAMRVNVAVTVVTILDARPVEKVGSVEAVISLPTVNWTANMVGLLHSVFYMGYFITQIPGGYLTTIFPSHKMFGGVLLCSGSLNLLLPLAMNSGGYIITCTIRIVQGLFEGMLYPTCYAVMRHWTIPEERSQMGAIVLTGVYLGPVVGLAVSGAITHYIGWQYVYYVHGFGAIAWFVVWLFLSYETPADNPLINQQELKLIEKSQGDTAVIYKNEVIPWKSIFTSLPVAALNVSNFARNWVFYLLLTNEPLYINMFGFSLAENGVFSAIPHLIMAVFALCSGPLADLLIRDILLTRTNVRKMFTGIGFGAEAACMLILGFTVSGVPALIFLSLGVGISGLTVSGWQINHLDIAPRYASVLVGLSTTVGTIAGIMIPLVTGWLTSDMTIEGWQHVYLLTTGILVFAIVFYTIFASGDLQPWAEPKPNVQIVHKQGPLDSSTKPYGTFPAQIDNLDKGSYQTIPTTVTDGDTELSDHPDSLLMQPNGQANGQPNGQANGRPESYTGGED